MKKLGKSTFVSLIAVFAAFNVVCDSLVGPPIPYSGVWFSWIFVSEPITGILLTPLASFFSVLIGVMVGHFINFIGVEEFLFTLGAPVGAMISSLVFRGKWSIPLIYYMALLSAFFVTPISWQLPLWGMWDVYLAFICLLGTSLVVGRWRKLWNTKSSSCLIYILALSTFIGLEADVLFRIFVFIPCQTYKLFYNLDVIGLQSIWVVGAVETSTKAALSTLIAAIVGLPIIGAVRKMGLKTLED